MQVPVFGWALAQFRPIAIDRSAGRRAIRQLLIEGAERLAAGYWVVIFPEGTRVEPGRRKEFGIGGALLAERTGATVVPIAHNAGVFWRRRGLRKYPGCIQLVVGPPIQTRGATAATINAAAEAWIKDTMADLPTDREAAPPEGLVPHRGE
jgi:1-acyl-sn-glycerol-3-phosphate acyltransferase